MKKLTINNEPGIMVDTELLQDVSKEERFRLREWAVLLTIIGLNILSGMAPSVEQGKIRDWNSKILLIWQLCHTLVHIPATVVLAMISDLHGRKPIFIILYSFSIVSSIFRLITDETCLYIGLFIQGLVDGGTLHMTYLSITEFSRPMHRFVYLLLNVTVIQIAANVVWILYDQVLAKDSVHVSIVMIVLALAGVGSVFVWPESPYWLYARGRRGDAAWTLRWLRGTCAEPELNQLDHYLRTPGPVKAYWLSLFIAIVTISISLLSSWQDVLLSVIYYEQKDLLSNKLRIIVSIVTNIASFAILALISYKVKRKILFLIAAGIPLVISFVPVAWKRLKPLDENVDNTSFYIVLLIGSMLRKYGPAILARAVYIEVIPYKYNTHMSCICIVYYVLLNAFFTFLVNAYKSMNIFAIAFMVFSLLGVIVYYWLAPETKDKTLLEIQNSYISKENDITEQPVNQIEMKDIEEQDSIERL